MKTIVLAVLVTLALLFGVGCRTLAVSRALYGGGPPAHIYHPDKFPHDLKCDRYGELLPNVTIDEYLDRAREIDDCKRAHGGMP